MLELERSAANLFRATWATHVAAKNCITDQQIGLETERKSQHNNGRASSGGTYSKCLPMGIFRCACNVTSRRVRAYSNASPGEEDGQTNIAMWRCEKGA
jgi:hypothetical protein